MSAATYAPAETTTKSDASALVTASFLPLSVDVTVHRSAVREGGNYYLTCDPEILVIEKPTSDEMFVITWNLIDATGGTETPRFFDPAIIFLDPMAPALTKVVDPDRQTFTAYWSNSDLRNRREWPYTIHVRIGSEVAVMDPTVENQPPLYPTP